MILRMIKEEDDKKTYVTVEVTPQTTEENSDRVWLILRASNSVGYYTTTSYDVHGRELMYTHSMLSWLKSIILFYHRHLGTSIGERNV